MKLKLFLFVLNLVSIQAYADSSLLIGKWCESGSDVQKCEAIETFYEDGTVSAEGVLKEYGIRYKASGYWKLKGKIICLNFTNQQTFELSTGKEIVEEPIPEFCNEVISTSSNKHVYKNSASGNIQTMYRIE